MMQMQGGHPGQRLSGDPPGTGIASADDPLEPPTGRQPLREILAGVLLIVQGLVLLVVALIMAVTPHSAVCHAANGRVETCADSEVVPLGVLIGAATLGGLVLLAVAGALLAQSRWARPVGLMLDGVLAAGALAALLLSFVQATPADRTTYAALWVMGAVFVVVLFTPCALLWSVRPGPSRRR
jgi:hypothetical protein